MRKFKVVCDPNTHSFGSADIIVRAINQGAKNVGLHSENDAVIVYDCLCNSHGYNPDAFWCAFELPFAKPVIQNAAGKPIFGLSKANAMFAIEGGYPSNKVGYVNLGVDTNIWKPATKKYFLDKFVILAMNESNSRSGLELFIPYFAEYFSGNKDVMLYLKDREATPTFKQWVKDIAARYDVEIYHDDRHLEDHQEEVKIFESCDCHFYVNHVGSFNMTVMQGMACGIPTVTIEHGGPADFICHGLNGFGVDFDLVPVTSEYLQSLERMGIKNHIFPPDSRFYNYQPFWAQMKKDSLFEYFDAIQDQGIRNRFRENGIWTAKEYSWDKAAITMSHNLTKL